MEKCSSCSKTNRWRTRTNRRIEEINVCTAQYIQTIEKLLQELNELYAQDVENNSEDDQHNVEDDEEDEEDEGEGDEDESDEDESDEDEDEDDNDDSDTDDVHDDLGQTDVYFCPEVECRQRKADTTFKKYSRHYTTHVKCKVSCVGCNTTLVTVSTLKRHFTGCAELKKKRFMPEHMKAIERMRCWMNNESKKASMKAREALQGHKRRRQPNLNSSKSRKRAKLERFSDASLLTSRARSKNSPIASNSIIDHEPNGCDIADAAEHAHLGFRLSSASSVTMNTSHQPSLPVDGQLNTQNNITMGFANNQYSTQDTDAAAKSKSDLDEMTNESAMYTRSQYHTAQNSATATSAPNMYFANNQYSTTEGTATAMRGSSFMSYTMDGSFMNPDDHYPTARNAVTAMRGSSFINNTMDGSFMYTDEYPTTQNADMQSLESWRPT